MCGRSQAILAHPRPHRPNENAHDAIKHYGVNVACLKGVSPFDFADVPVIDGVNHPADHGRGYAVYHKASLCIVRTYTFSRRMRPYKLPRAWTSPPGILPTIASRPQTSW